MSDIINHNLLSPVGALYLYFKYYNLCCLHFLLHLPTLPVDAFRFFSSFRSCPNICCIAFPYSCVYTEQEMDILYLQTSSLALRYRVLWFTTLPEPNYVFQSC